MKKRNSSEQQEKKMSSHNLTGVFMGSGKRIKGSNVKKSKLWTIYN